MSNTFQLFCVSIFATLNHLIEKFDSTTDGEKGVVSIFLGGSLLDNRKINKDFVLKLKDTPFIH